GGGLAVELTTEPSGAYMIWIPAGVAKAPPSADTLSRGEHFIRMEGKETYRFATRTLASTALASIERAGLKPSDIDLFIPHQANERIINAVGEKLKIASSKVYKNIERYGNTSAASIPIALDECAREGRIHAGNLVLLTAFGAGLVWGSVLMRW
ncbi:MAG TPA: 3-oxoacyl-[acyl-carrier-protein] synthase III C-terminal domain-containing protein, partial [Candidatus Polarisedimenticolia bacterium]|nr:3-oxoacyl-[acyl-carrier-protein] synthase III C-terminal domain-containing protein [Candidatus Polarisedimenticolia bacterium]